MNEEEVKQKLLLLTTQPPPVFTNNQQTGKNHCFPIHVKVVDAKTVQDVPFTVKPVLVYPFPG